MTQRYLELGKIIELLKLKRQYVETLLGRLQKQDQELALAIKELQLSVSSESNPNIDGLALAKVTAKWSQWRLEKITELQKKRDELAPKIDTHITSLQTLLAQLDALSLQFEKEKSQAHYIRENANANQRLETWLTTRPT